MFRKVIWKLIPGTFKKAFFKTINFRKVVFGNSVLNFKRVFMEDILIPPGFTFYGYGTFYASLYGVRL